jgi:hypothetical protein
MKQFYFTPTADSKRIVLLNRPFWRGWSSLLNQMLRLPHDVLQLPFVLPVILPVVLLLYCFCTVDQAFLARLQQSDDSAVR